MRFFIAAIAVFTLMQVAPVEMRTNPHTNPNHTMEARLNVPPPIESMLKQSCANCHSNDTHWPWYSSIAPVSWMIANDVNRARAAMNFSEWTDRPGRAKGLLVAACAGAQSQRMPPANYRMLHPESALTPQQSAQFCAWTVSQSRALSGPLHTQDQPRSQTQGNKPAARLVQLTGAQSSLSSPPAAAP